jgi:hypothetical protein
MLNERTLAALANATTSQLAYTSRPVAGQRLVTDGSLAYALPRIVVMYI